LPGVGPKSAQRLAFHVLRASRFVADDVHAAFPAGPPRSRPGVDYAARWLDQMTEDYGATYGAYQFRESFGARWVELTGAHRKTMHSLGGSVGRVAAAVRRLGRLAPGR